MSQKKSPIQKAVALQYDPTDQAPRVIAKGKGIVADQIMDRGKRHGVPIQEDPSLVEVLSKLDLDTQIPPELYQVVAEILGWIYRSDQQLGQRRKEGIVE